MLIKVIGMAMVLFSSTLSGLMIADKYKTRVSELKELRNHFQIIETEIIYTATPVSEVIEKISRQSQEPYKGIYKSILKELRKREGRSLGQIWKEVFEENKQETRLKSEDLDIIYFFGSVLGTSDRENQLKNTQLVQSQLIKHQENAEEEQLKNEKLFRNLGVLLGLALIIILI